MTKRRRYGLAIMALLTVSLVACGAFWLQRARTHAVRVDKAIADIRTRLLADPNYLVTEQIMVRAKEPSFADATSLLNPGLQVSVMKRWQAGPPRWGLWIRDVFRLLPRCLRPSPSLYLRTREYDWIGIVAVEPTPAAMEELKQKVQSLGLPRDIRIQFSPFDPDRNEMRQQMEKTGFMPVGRQD